MQDGKYFDPNTLKEIPDPTAVQPIAPVVAPLPDSQKEPGPVEVPIEHPEATQPETQEGLRCKFCRKVYLFDKTKQNQGRATGQMAKHLREEHQNLIDEENVKCQ